MHKHKFKNIGGWCMINSNDKFPCDDSYKCDCGLKFSLKTNEVGHRFLPEIIEEEEMSELKKTEQSEILNAKFN